MMKIYEGMRTYQTFHQAQATCRYRHAQIASIGDHSQNYQVMQACNALGRDTVCWIGLQYPFEMWNAAHRVKYRNWISNAPAPKTGGCAEIYPDGKWNAMHCNKRRAFVCQRNGRRGRPSMAMHHRYRPMNGNYYNRNPYGRRRRRRQQYRSQYGRSY